VTVTGAFAVAVPPMPVQVSVNVVLAESVLLGAVPLVDRSPDQPPEAVHDVAFVLVQESWVVLPLTAVVGVAVKLTVGAGTTVTVFVSLAVPPVPVQLSVNVVFAEIALLIMLPFMDCPPDQPPEALHELAFALVHDSCVLAPFAIAVGFSARLTVGAGTTVTVFESLLEPPTPVQVSVNVVFVASALLVSLPLVPLESDQPPDALQELAFVLVQESFVVAPLAIVAGFKVRLTVGGPTTATDFASLPVPPGPVQVSVNDVFVERAALVALPLGACAPAHPPDAVHDVALVLVHDSFAVPPIATLLGVTCSDTVGGGVGAVCVVALAAADSGDSLRFGLMRSNAVTV
jgi:hypothetical protein